MTRGLYLPFCFILVLIISEACRKEVIENVPYEVPMDSNPTQSNHYKINMSWYQSDTETKDEFILGMKWGLSFLGAKLESSAWKSGVNWETEKTFQIQFDKLGFAPSALRAISELNAIIIESEAYKQKGFVDAGRWLVLAAINSEHYYRIVGLPERYGDFIKEIDFDNKRYGVIESAVSNTPRIILLPSEKNWRHQKYAAQEIEGKLTDGSARIKEFEVMDVMENGQLRFGVYNLNGMRINGANSVFSNAGKPSKCLWCHETNIQAAFGAISDVDGYYTKNQFDSIVRLKNKELDSYRATLKSDLDFTKKPDHAHFEKLYLRFYEPSAKRLSQEWGISEEEVLRKLSGISTHRQEEFSEFGEIYHRSEVEMFAPFKSISTPISVRETDYSESSLIK